MADVTLVQPVSDGDTVTATTLHQMIETATIGSLTSADLSAGQQVLFSGPSPPDPSLYSFWWSTRYEDQVLRVYARPFDIWLAIGPDRFEFPMVNGAATMLAKGALVVAAGASTFTIATNPTLAIIGHLQDTAASGAWAPVASCGIGFVDCESADSDANNLAAPVTPLGAAAGRVRQAWPGGTANSASNMSNPHHTAVLLDASHSGAWSGVTEHGFRAILWGNKRNIGFS